MTHENQLTDPQFRNWVKASLGLKSLKEGVEGFIEQNIKYFHSKILTEIGNVLGQSNVFCNQCTTANVLPCPTKGVCSYARNICRYHDTRDPTKTPKKCPTDVCNKIHNKIVAAHRFSSPSWKNTAAEEWCSNPWQVAKCYMAATGYLKVLTANETDCTGLLQVAINNLFIQNSLTCRISVSPPYDIFSKNRLARNEILHSASLQVTDTHLQDYINNMILLLKDQTTLLHDNGAKDAVCKLEKLRRIDLVITTHDEIAARRDALAAIEQKRREAIEAIAEGTQAAIASIEEKGQTILDEIREEHRQRLATLQQQEGLMDDNPSLSIPSSPIVFFQQENVTNWNWNCVTL